MITSDNFCHIQQVNEVVKVLFWVEHDGDEAIIHQIATLEIGTFDLKIKMPSEKLEKLWPESMRFADAAEKVISTATELGFYTPTKAARCVECDGYNCDDGCAFPTPTKKGGGA